MQNHRIEIRMSKEEKEGLSKKAEKNGLSLSEYIRSRLFETQNFSQDFAYKKDMTTFAVFGYYLLGKMAKHKLTEEEIQECSKRASLFLKEYDMIPD